MSRSTRNSRRLAEEPEVVRDRNIPIREPLRQFESSPGFRVQISPSGKAACKRCGLGIPKGEFRVNYDEGDNPWPLNAHIHCYFVWFNLVEDVTMGTGEGKLTQADKLRYLDFVVKRNVGAYQLIKQHKKEWHDVHMQLYALANALDDDSESDEDLKRAMALSLGQAEPQGNAMDDGVGSEEQDEDLKRALKLSLAQAKEKEAPKKNGAKSNDPTGMKRSHATFTNSNNSETTITSLPDEVTGRILECLGLFFSPQTVIACQRVSRAFQSIVQARVSDVAWGRMAFRLKNQNQNVAQATNLHLSLDERVKAWALDGYFGVEGRLLFQAFYVTKFLSRCDTCQSNFGSKYSPLFGRNICRNCAGNHYYYGDGGPVVNKGMLTKNYGVSGEDMERFGLESLQYGSSRLFSENDAKIVKKLKANGIKSL